MKNNYNNCKTTKHKKTQIKNKKTIRKNTKRIHNTKNKKKDKALNNIKKFIEDQHNKKTIRQ